MAFLKNIWKTNNSKHKKLPEELVLQDPKDVEMENEIDVVATENNEEIVTFKLKYLGSTVVEKVSGENISVEAVKNIIKVAKASSRKKLQRVNLNISLKGITVNDLQGTEILQLSIYRISNCSTDASHKQVFSFISTDADETTECHAFLCSKRKLAETVTLAIAHAFSTAYEAWRILPTTKKFEQGVDVVDEMRRNETESSAKTDDTTVDNATIDVQLIDFETDDDFSRRDSATKAQLQMNNEWVSFDDDFLHETRPCNPWSSRNQHDLILA